MTMIERRNEANAFLLVTINSQRGNFSNKWTNITCNRTGVKMINCGHYLTLIKLRKKFYFSLDIHARLFHGNVVQTTPIAINRWNKGWPTNIGSSSPSFSKIRITATIIMFRFRWHFGRIALFHFTDTPNIAGKLALFLSTPYLLAIVMWT